MKFPELSRYAKDGVINLLTLLPMIAESNAVKALQLIWNTAGYGQYVIANKLDAGKCATLCLLGENESSPQELLRRMSELRAIIQNHRNNEENKFILSTIHSSKGLEYDRVFLLDIFDGTLPSKAVPDPASEDEFKQYEEDRRLYYVGMTRAKNELYIFNCRNTESIFTSEVLNSLPQEVVDADSVVAVFKQGFCGRTYLHKDNGKGIVTAQCGYDVLVEYESGLLQMLSISQLFEQRDTATKYAPVQIPTKKKPSERKVKKTIALNAAEEKQLLSKATAGREVMHNKFGHGVISQNDGQYVTIRFDGIPGEKKFDLIMAVKNNLLSL